MAEKLQDLRSQAQTFAALLFPLPQVRGFIPKWHTREDLNLWSLESQRRCAELCPELISVGRKLGGSRAFWLGVSLRKDLVAIDGRKLDRSNGRRLLSKRERRSEPEQVGRLAMQSNPSIVDKIADLKPARVHGFDL